MLWLIEWFLKKHVDAVIARYPDRNVRPVDLFALVLNQAQRVDKDGTYLTASFFEGLAEKAEEFEDRAMFSFVSSLLAGFVVLSLTAGDHIVITILQFKLENVGFLFELVLIAFGASCYFAAANVTSALALAAI